MRRSLAPGAVLFIAILAWSGVLTPPTFDGLPVSPLATLIMVPVLRALMFGFGAFALGASVVGGMLSSNTALLRRGSNAALVYSAASALLVVATLADVLASSLLGAMRPTMLWSFVTQIEEGRYLAAQTCIGLAAAWILRSNRPQALAAVELLSISVVLPAFTGHSAAAVSHWIASATMVVHLEAMSLWVGGVMALYFAPEAINRFGNLALGSYFALALSGVASVFARTTDWSALIASHYGLVLAGKIAVTVGLGLFGYQQRQFRVAQDEEAARRTLTREVVLMGLAFALAITLARMANP